jgi:hypothetical protein
LVLSVGGLEEELKILEGLATEKAATEVKDVDQARNETEARTEIMQGL